MHNKFKLFFAAILTASFIMVSCQTQEKSPILKEVFNSNELPELIEKVQNDQKLTKDEIDLLAAGISRNLNTLDSINGKTLEQIIILQSDFLKNSAITTLTNTAIGTSIQSRYIGWQPDSVNLKNIDGFKIYIKNKTNKEIKRVFGRLNFFNNQNQVLGLFDVNLNVTVQPEKESIILAKISSVNQDNGINDLAKIRDILENQPNTLFAQWTVIEVEFADGKNISLAPKK